jgi:hypothetical protein
VTEAPEQSSLAVASMEGLEQLVVVGALAGQVIVGGVVSLQVTV